MSKRPKKPVDRLPPPDFFDLAGMDPELLNSHRIPDPQPEHTRLFRWLARVLTSIEARLRAPGDSAFRGAIKFGWAGVMLIGAFLILGPVINKPLDFDDIIESAEVSEVDWFARDAKIDYSIARASDGTLVAQVTERYTASFINGPESGVERTIVTEFKGHDVDFALMKAEIDGVNADVATVRRATTTELRLTRADGAKLQGEQEIVITYELHHLVSQQVDEATGRVVDQLEWPLFAPTWPQATKGVEVSLTLPHEINDALVRQPQGSIAWLLVGASVWLTVDETTADGVRYAFSNDQALPPNAEVWLDAMFEPGTFELPPKTWLFWVQTYGPLLPLALLGILLLSALAARRVVWADSAGKPWFLPRSEPPNRCTPELAARLRGKPRHAELIELLARAPEGNTGGLRLRTRTAVTSWHTALAREGTRTGRLGATPTAWGWRLRWQKHDTVVKRKLRWVPNGYVRDTLQLAPVAITLLQWGLLRQLSEQLILSIVWWPFTFVVISTVLAMVTLAVVYRPRPLTPEGALLVQQLRGIDIYAKGTRLLDRGSLTDPLLPYAVLGEHPRRAGRAVAEMAIREEGDLELRRGWRSEHFMSAPALLAFAAALMVLAGTIVLVSTTPPPYDTERRLFSEYGNLPGTSLTQIEGYTVAAELSRDAQGSGRLRVTEQSTVNFSSGGGVPQLMREWPSERLGQDLGVTVSSVRIDGRPVPYREMPQRFSLAMVTQLEEVLQGLHEVEIVYESAAPAVNPSAGADAPQQVRWAAQYSGWEDYYYVNPLNPFEGDARMRPLSVQLTVADDLVDEMTSGGWIDWDHERERVPFEHGNWFEPWEYDFAYAGETPGDGPSYGSIGTIDTRADGAAVMTLDFAGLPEGLTKYSAGQDQDLGVLLNFAPDTFSGVDADGFANYQRSYDLPNWVALGLAGLVTLAAIGAGAFAFATRRPVSSSLALVSFWALPLAATAQSILFFWTYMSMDGGDLRMIPALLFGAPMWIAVVAQGYVVSRRRGVRTSVESRALA